MRISRPKILIFTFILLALTFFNISRWHSKHSKKTYVTCKSVKPKLVLIFTTLFGRKPWPTIENDHEFNNWNNIPCPVRNCRVSFDEKDINESDAVLFHGQDINDLDLQQLTKSVGKYRAKQRWIFFIHENPLFFSKDFDKLRNVFNWTMTYKIDSDIFVPFLYYFKKPKIDSNVAAINYAQGKDRLVAWMVSHCGKQRDELVTKLLTYIPIHIYGGCGRMFGQNRDCKRDDGNCLKELRRYKFYLAFENANCVDYITEKYWYTSIKNGVIPVVLGGGNYSDSRLAIPGSYINVLDFKSVKDLVEHMKMLDKNDTAYNEYFSWRKRYYVDYPTSWTCKLCEMLNNESQTKKIYSPEQFEKFWGIRNNCGFLDEKVNRIIAEHVENNKTVSNITVISK